MANEDKINFLNERRDYLQFVRLEGQMRTNGDPLDPNSASKTNANSNASKINAYPGTSFKLLPYVSNVNANLVSTNGSCAATANGYSSICNDPTVVTAHRNATCSLLHSHCGSNATDNDSLLSDNSFSGEHLVDWDTNQVHLRAMRSKSVCHQQVQCDPVAVSTADVDCQVDLDCNELYSKLKLEHMRTKKQLDSMSYVVEEIVRERSTLFLRMHEMNKKLTSAEQELAQRCTELQQMNVEHMQLQADSEQKQKYIEQLECLKQSVDRKCEEIEQSRLKVDQLTSELQQINEQKQQLQTVIDNNVQENRSIVERLNSMQNENGKCNSKMAEQRVEMDKLNEKLAALRLTCNDLQVKLQNEQQITARLNGEVQTITNQNEKLNDRLEQVITNSKNSEQLLIRQICVWEQQISQLLHNSDLNSLIACAADQVQDENVLSEYCTRFWKKLIDTILEKDREIDQLRQQCLINDQVDHANDCLNEKNMKNNAANAEIQTEIDLKSMSEQFDNDEQKTHHLQRLLDEKDKCIETLKQRQEQQNVLKNAEIDRLNNRLSDLICSFESRTQEFKQCRMSLEESLNSKQNQIREEKQDQLQIKQDLDTIKNALLESNRLLQLRCDENRDLQEKIIELELERSRVMMHSEHIAAQLQEVKSENVHLKQTADAGQQDVISECTCLRLSLKERDELIEQLRDEIDALKKKIKFLNEKHVEEVQIMKKDHLIAMRKNTELDCENAKLNMRLCELRQVIRSNLEQTKQLRNQIENNKTCAPQTLAQPSWLSAERLDSDSEAGSSSADDRIICHIRQSIGCLKERIAARQKYFDHKHL